MLCIIQTFYVRKRNVDPVIAPCSWISSSSYSSLFWFHTKYMKNYSKLLYECNNRTKNDAALLCPDYYVTSVHVSLWAKVKTKTEQKKKQRWYPEEQSKQGLGLWSRLEMKFLVLGSIQRFIFKEGGKRS